MAVGICRVGKVKIGGVAHIQKHVNRERKNYRNKDIDKERTHLNYDLIEQDDALINRIMRRIDEGRNSTRALRVDAVVMADGIITASPEFFEYLSEEEQRQFFQDAFEFCCKEFGKENMMYFTVHLDETTPHAHFGFVPLKDGSLSWKNYFKSPRSGDLSLQAFQDRFWEGVSLKWGLERGEKRSGDDEIVRHKDTETLKRESRLAALREEKEINERLERLRQQEEEIARDVEQLESAVALCERFDNEPRKGKSALLTQVADICDAARGKIEGRIAEFTRLLEEPRRRIEEIGRRIFELAKGIERSEREFENVARARSQLMNAQIEAGLLGQVARSESFEESINRAKKSAAAWNARVPNSVEKGGQTR